MPSVRIRLPPPTKGASLWHHFLSRILSRISLLGDFFLPLFIPAWGQTPQILHRRGDRPRRLCRMWLCCNARHFCMARSYVLCDHDQVIQVLFVFRNIHTFLYFIIQLKKKMYLVLFTALPLRSKSECADSFTETGGIVSFAK